MNTRSRTWTLSTFAAAAMAIALTIPSTFAAVITIVNPGFEAASGAAGNGNLASPDLWIEENGGQVFVDNNGLTWTPEADRELYLNANNAGVNQNLNFIWLPTDTFTVDIKAVEPIWYGGSTAEFKVQLREQDGTVLWDSGVENVDGTVSGSPGNVSYTGTGHLFNWTFDASTFGSIPGAASGSALNIRIASVNSGPVYLDDISLEASAVHAIPEPSTMALYGIGGLLIYLRHRNLFLNMV